MERLLKRLSGVSRGHYNSLYNASLISLDGGTETTSVAKKTFKFMVRQCKFNLLRWK